MRARRPLKLTSFLLGELQQWMAKLLLLAIVIGHFTANQNFTELTVFSKVDRAGCTDMANVLGTVQTDPR